MEVTATEAGFFWVESGQSASQNHCEVDANQEEEEEETCSVRPEMRCGFVSRLAVQAASLLYHRANDGGITAPAGPPSLSFSLLVSLSSVILFRRQISSLSHRSIYNLFTSVSVGCLKLPYLQNFVIFKRLPSKRTFGHSWAHWGFHRPDFHGGLNKCVTGRMPGWSQITPPSLAEERQTEVCMF